MKDDGHPAFGWGQAKEPRPVQGQARYPGHPFRHRYQTTQTDPKEGILLPFFPCGNQGGNEGPVKLRLSHGDGKLKRAQARRAFLPDLSRRKADEPLKHRDPDLWVKIFGLWPEKAVGKGLEIDNGLYQRPPVSQEKLTGHLFRPQGLLALFHKAPVKDRKGQGPFLLQG